ncbi:MAG TPA: helix-turn-helix domain-containing protein [Candidatus Limnocylindrales bacterium]
MSKPNRLVVLLDSLLNGGGPRSVHLSRYHYDRLVRSVSGEPPARLRRRVLMEQAAYALSRGARVTDVAFASGYESAEGFSRAFSRAFACAPRDFCSRRVDYHLPAPNGIHFHPPCGLLLPGFDEKGNGMDLTERLIEHDLWLTGELLDRAAELSDDVLDKPIEISVEGVDCDPSIRNLLASLVGRKEAWGAMFAGLDLPQETDKSVRGLKRRWDVAKAQYGGEVRRIASESAWDTTFIDAECDPPQTFTYGGAVAHVLTFSAHRRTLVLGALHDAGVTDLGSGDPMRFERR